MGSNESFDKERSRIERLVEVRRRSNVKQLEREKLYEVWSKESSIKERIFLKNKREEEK